MKALKEHPICRGVAVIVMALMTLTTTAPDCPGGQPSRGAADRAGSGSG